METKSVIRHLLPKQKRKFKQLLHPQKQTSILILHRVVKQKR
jgi:hypothetical protein